MNGRIRVRRYAGERCLSECVIERYSVLTPGVMLEVVPFLQGIPEAIFQQDNASSHVAKTVRVFVQPTQATSSLACLFTDMSPIEHVWDLVGWRLARDLRPTASKEFLLRIQAIWNSLQKASIQNLFDSRLP
ncbi:transposable element Tcb2 transposase [Trichonephila clavipes]|nr:transposable element Tcb2 transposase [Trichonephila clavipes]